MKKLGFTLSELIISLAIIGVISALTIPAVTNIFPDQYKAKVLKYHAEIAQAIDLLLDDDSIYYCTGDPSDPNSKAGLACDGKPIYYNYKKGADESKYSGDTKFEYLLADKLGLTPSGNATRPWKLPNGSTWKITKVKGAEGSVNQDSYEISIDLNGSNGPNSQYRPASYKADRFGFVVDNFGGLKAKDALTEAYLRNPMNLNDKKNDKKLAKEIHTSSNKSDTSSK